ncbi:MAG: hypothetical protein GY711_05605 [bacterium]|nr:hypothetical protein [bacterium]
MIRLVASIVLIAPALAQGPILPGGTPDPGFPSFYAWFDASDGVNGPGQPTSGTPATTWVDNTGQGRDLVRVDADPTRQPVFDATSAGGRPALVFGGDDYIWADGATEFGTVASSKTIFVVFRTDTLSNGYVFDSSSVQGRNALFNGQTSAPDTWQLFSGAAPITTGPAVAVGQPQVFTAIFEASSNELFIDGVQSGAGTSVMSPMVGIILGSRYTVTNFVQGTIAELLFYDERLDSLARKQVESYLTSKYLSGPVGTSYCGPAIPNSTGFPGRITATGSSAVAANNLTLVADDLPPGQFGYFLAGEVQGFFQPPGSTGFICLSGNIGRYNQTQNIIMGPMGSISADLTSIPVNPPTAVMPGDTWNFQCWYRDAGPSNNFTDGLTVTFQ